MDTTPTPTPEHFHAARAAYGATAAQLRGDSEGLQLLLNMAFAEAGFRTVIGTMIGLAANELRAMNRAIGVSSTSAVAIGNAPDTAPPAYHVILDILRAQLDEDFTLSEHHLDRLLNEVEKPAVIDTALALLFNTVRWHAEARGTTATSIVTLRCNQTANMELSAPR